MKTPVDDDDDDEDQPSDKSSEAKKARPLPSGAAKGFSLSIESPLSTDVIHGRGKPFQDHPGNKDMRKIVARLHEQHEKSERRDKNLLVEQVVAEMKAKGARFLKQEDGRWVTVDHAVAFEKVSHAFRSHHGRKRRQKQQLQAPPTPLQQLQQSFQSTISPQRSIHGSLDTTGLHQLTTNDIVNPLLGQINSFRNLREQSLASQVTQQEQHLALLLEQERIRAAASNPTDPSNNALSRLGLSSNTFGFLPLQNIFPGGSLSAFGRPQSSLHSGHALNLAAGTPLGGATAPVGNDLQSSASAIEAVLLQQHRERQQRQRQEELLLLAAASLRQPPVAEANDQQTQLQALIDAAILNNEQSAGNRNDGDTKPEPSPSNQNPDQTTE